MPKNNKKLSDCTPKIYILGHWGEANAQNASFLTYVAWPYFFSYYLSSNVSTLQNLQKMEPGCDFIHKKAVFFNHCTIHREKKLHLFQ